ncbi:MAG: formate--tetrahydrofolate ligase [Candidatus Poseidoniales archaeon]|jgi:formate--tetrahydrofolate ligase|nr:formate--tetrahydrofolate ligase [Candidatus Poseidoniales archaeon]RZD50645.1 MAG: formate--tetrahydrofolate ligase [Euryarchaeota archaeon]HIG38659.1 formate--tetrahydrofolate ligase [Candidatus Poseidoniales archaeon]HIL43528.1 formate--tetrahydrofolate ligase [Candidatus Poseidoniales archaeon]|tara:strand:+ start:673 stop:2388 length:1716 start_codon:yes stop_codon:yes gene_type:complete
MDSDLDIARNATMRPIEEVAEQLGLARSDLILHGPHIAKINWETIKTKRNGKSGYLILVTSVSPTAFGEGKTVTTIGLNQGLNARGHNACCVIREPSMGPVFGIKGGAAGGGYSQVLPMEQINLHFTGDLHAVTSAHNLCSAIIDNHLHRGNELDIDLNRIYWPRTIDMNDRSLRQVTIGLGGAFNGVVRTDRFDITAASEVMAILALSKDYSDLRERLGCIVIAKSNSGEPITTEQLGAAGSMSLLLRDALMPNLVQTLEGNPAFIHCGPFANIAHGNSSIIADEIALSCVDYVVTEAGFGAEMGAEKALHIKAPAAGRVPDCLILNATVRAMKMHGGGFASGGGRRPTTEELETENVEATRAGAASNLRRHVRNLVETSIPVIVSINRFEHDTEAEIEAIRDEAIKAGAKQVVLNEVFAKGGEGATELADAVVAACASHDEAGRPYTPIVEHGMAIEETILRVATNLYGAQTVDFSDKAQASLKTLNEWGMGSLPVCMAKNQYSFSHEPKVLGAPTGFTLPIREIRVNAGAGFVVAVCGSMMTMPGLPTRPAALDMDMDDEGRLTGAFR